MVKGLKKLCSMVPGREDIAIFSTSGVGTVKKASQFSLVLIFMPCSYHWYSKKLFSSKLVLTFDNSD